MNQLITTNGNSSDLITFDREKVDLIKRTIMHPDATDDELDLFLHQSRRMGLDPLAKQIHAVFRWDKRQNRNVMSIQVAIDGYRLIADRTGKYAGNDDPVFDEGLTHYEHIQTGRKTPATATVTVYKIVAGMRVPFTATATWQSYAPPQGSDFMWRKMPHLMLAKCAEALALRKAFPAELSGVYIHEEMEQAGFVEVDNVQVIDAGAIIEEPEKGGQEYYDEDGEPLPDDEQVILETPRSDYMKTLIALIPRYDNAEAIKNALKKLGFTGVSSDEYKRLEMYRALKEHAEERDTEEQRPLFDDEPEPTGAYAEG